MDMTIRLYWSGGERNEINFGDSISPLIVEMMAGKPVRYADISRCDVVAIGSILNKTVDKAWKRLLGLRLDKVQVWGSGAFSDKHLGANRFLSIHAVRGPRTREAMRAADDLPLGDPGLLIDRFEMKQHPRSRWGIIPHLHDREHKTIRELQTSTPGAIIVDLADPDLFTTMAAIRACDFVISTSLHGLITADAFGIPNIWLRVNDHFHTSDWKFLDYFASVGRGETAPLAPGPALSSLTALEGSASRPNMTLIRERQNGLEKAFGQMGL